jgi:hypothetical protein
MDKSSKNVNEHQIWISNFFLDSQPFPSIQSTVSSWQKDLQDVVHDFRNREI